MHPFICKHKGRTIEVQARSTYEAQTIAAATFKARKPWEVIVMRADLTHTPVD